MPRRLPSPDEALRILGRKRSRPLHRPPPPAGRALSSLIRDLDQKFGQGPAALQARWREIAGEALSARTEPVKLSKPRGGGPAVLELKVAGPMAALIQHQAPEILARVNLFLGEGSVGKLRIVQGPVKSPPSRTVAMNAVQARRRKARPLDAAEEAGLAAGLAEAPDGPLKSALLRLGREVLRREAADAALKPQSGGDPG